MNLFYRFSDCLFFLAIFFACDSTRHAEQISGRPIESDSLAIVELFNQALAQPAQSDSLVRLGRALGENSGSLRDTYLFNLSRFYIQTGKIAIADSVIDSIINQYKDREMNYPLGKFYNLKAAAAAYQHQQERSIYYYQQAIAIFERHQDHKQLAVVQFNLANTFFSRLDYNSAYKYIKEAKANFEGIGDSTYLPLADGILAVALTKLDEGEQSKAYAETALVASTKSNNPLGKILAHYALGEYYLHIDSFTVALQHYQEAKQLSQAFNIPNMNLPLKAALLVALNNLGRYHEAVAVGNEALEIAKAVNNIEIQYSLNKNLAEALAHDGQELEAYEHLKEAEAIFRNNTVANNEETLQKLLIEYETEKKNNLILQQDNAIAKQRTSIFSLATLALVGVVVFISYRRSVGQQRKIEQRNSALKIARALTQGEEKERIRLANELHDGIASNLVAIKLQLEAPKADRGGGCIALVKKTHEEVRKIAHNLMPINFEKQDWQQALAAFCGDMSSGKTRIEFAGSADGVKLPQDHALILYRCIQELIQNAVKHSGAERVDVQVLTHQSGLRITVEDNGSGFDVQEAVHGGVTLFKYKDRLQQIGATFDVDSRIGTGTTAFIHYDG